MPPSAVPERLAVFGDVHANLPALDAVLGEIRAAGIRNGVCTGDAVLRGAHPEACVERIALLGWPNVAGNTDRKVTQRAPRLPGHPAAARTGSRSWTHHRLSEASLTYLAQLPQTVRVPVGRFTVLVMHGESEAPSGAIIDEATPHDTLVTLAAQFGTDAVVTGHTHRAFVREAGGCLFLNPGSVGEPVGTDGHPSWAWLAAGPAGLTAQLERATVSRPGTRNR